MSHQPNRARVRELARCLSVPQQVHGRTIFLDELYRNVQHRFLTRVREHRGDKLATTRVGDDPLSLDLTSVAALQECDRSTQQRLA